jgi:signal transduction histidine kinase
LDTSWAAVVLNSAPVSTVYGVPVRGDAGVAVEKRGPPAAAIPIAHAGATLGRIECGPRKDGAFLDEDRRLLDYFAARVAAAVHNVVLSAELSTQVDVVRQQAAELSASRERVVHAQDSERRRIQRDLHDGVQQEVVALGATLGLARQRLGRGDVTGATEILDDLERNIATLLHDVREFAYAIHPSVLSDQGLLEAVEAHAARLPIAMVVRAEPSLRRVRFPAHIETTAWYGLAEALSNVVKHADATQVVVRLQKPDHLLTVAIEDNGRGFEPTQPRGLGLDGLADRLDIVGGHMTIDSAPGRGTAVTLEIPLRESASRIPATPAERRHQTIPTQPARPEVVVDG